MTAPSTRRQKVRAMADQTASPEEAAVAKAMLSKTANTPEERLEVIADDIKAEWGKGIDAQFAVGHLLIEARATFAQDVEYGTWFSAQAFPFQLRTGHRLREAALREPEVRAFLSGQSDQTDRSVSGAVQLLNAGPKPVADGSDDDDAGELIPVSDAKPVDAAYAALRDAAMLIVGTEDEPRNAFMSLHIDDLAKCAGFIKSLAEAYNVARMARSA